jgi:hypothetical protein
VYSAYEIPSLVVSVQYGHLVYVDRELIERLGLLAPVQRFSSGHLTVVFAIALALKYVIGPVVCAAVLVAISSTYLTGRSSIAGAYRRAGSRIVPILCVTALYDIPMLAVYLADAAAATASLFASSVERAGLLVVSLACVFVMSGLLLARTLAVCSVALEGTRVRPAIWAALRRLTARKRRFRSIAAASVVLALWLGSTAVREAVWKWLPNLHMTNTVAIATVASLVDVAGWIVLAAFMVIFYYDIRVREEAFDLHLAAAAIEQRAGGAVTA